MRAVNSWTNEAIVVNASAPPDTDIPFADVILLPDDESNQQRGSERNYQDDDTADDRNSDLSGENASTSPQQRNEETTMPTPNQRVPAMATGATAHDSSQNAPAKPPKKPGLWKLAGRTIKKTKVGKTILNGIRDGIDGTKKTLGIGVGEIKIHIAETRVYQPEDVVFGMVEMELTEPIPADRLMIQLQGTRETWVPVDSSSSCRSDMHGSFRKERNVVYQFNYQIGGKQVYPCQGGFPFEVVIPRLRRRMSDETRNTMMGSIIVSVQSFRAAVQSPIDWSLIATLCIPGRFNMSKTIRIYVADEEY